MLSPLAERLWGMGRTRIQWCRGTHDELAEIFGVWIRTLQRWVARWRTGERTSRPGGGRWHSLIELSPLEATLAEAPDVTRRSVLRIQPPNRPTSLRPAPLRARYVVKKNGGGRVKWLGMTTVANEPVREVGVAVSSPEWLVFLDEPCANLAADDVIAMQTQPLHKSFAVIRVHSS